MVKRLTKAQHDDYINKRKVEAYQELVSALEVERGAIRSFGTFSANALEAEKHSVKAKRKYERWLKK